MEVDGRKRATSVDVARLAGVAQSTVSNVINGKARVSERVRKRVEDAMLQLDYHPNASARTLRTSRTNVIALIEQSRPMGGVWGGTEQLISTIEEARLRDYDVIVSLADALDGELQRLAGRGLCDGVIIMGVRRDDERVGVAADLKLPVVLVGSAAESYGLDIVGFDEAGAGEAAVEALVVTNHRHIVVAGEGRAVGDEPGVDDTSFYESVLDNGAESGVDTRLIRISPGEGDDAERAVDDLFRHLDDRLGIVVRSPEVAETVLLAMSRRGVSPGSGVSLVAVCSDHVASRFSFAVSNISPRPRDLSALAVETLLKRIDGELSDPTCVKLPPSGLSHYGSIVSYPEP